MLLVASWLHASECTPAGQSIASEGWSAQLKRICLLDGVISNSFRSPDKRKVIIADAKGFHLKINGAEIGWPEGRNLFVNGSEISWSPTSGILH